VVRGTQRRGSGGFGVEGRRAPRGGGGMQAQWRRRPGISWAQSHSCIRMGWREPLPAAPLARQPTGWLVSRSYAALPLQHTTPPTQSAHARRAARQPAHRL
jgi:hypothetical protein